MGATRQIGRLWLEVAGVLRRAPLAVMGSVLAAQVVASAVLAPVGAAGTDWLVQRSGRYAVANEEIAGFLLSVWGIAAMLVAATVWVAAAQLARGAAMVAAGSEARGGWGALHGLWGMARRGRVVLELAARKVGVLAALAAPFAALIGGVVWLVVRDVELYWLVNVRPARFWWGVAGVAPVALAGAWVLGRVWAGWSIALPLCVLDGRRAGVAMTESRELLSGRLGVIAAARLGWLVVCGLTGALALGAVHAGAEAVLQREWGGLQTTAAVAGASLLVYVLVAGASSLLLTAGDAVICLAAWRLATGRDERAATGHASSARRRIVRGVGVLAGAAVGAFALAAGLVESMDRPLAVEVTAHRGAERAAPENTLAAVRAAMELGADRVEIDVMRSADGALVVFHDSDLRRLASDTRKVSETTLEELKRLDVGAWFGAAFAGERIPTLDEVLDVTAGRIALNIELKANGDDAALADAVVGVVRQRLGPGGRGTVGGDLGEVIVTSLSAGALEAVRRADPAMPLGMIVSVAIGDVRRLDVDLLSIESKRATAPFMAAAAAAKLPVHAWTVNDPDEFTRLAMNGAAGVITADVETLAACSAELEELGDIERLLLAFRTRVLAR